MRFVFPTKETPSSTSRWRIIGTMRTWSNSSFLTALDSNTRTEAERKALVDELYGRYEDAIAADPEKNHMDYAHHYIVMEKVGQ